MKYSFGNVVVEVKDDGTTTYTLDGNVKCRGNIQMAISHKMSLDIALKQNRHRKHFLRQIGSSCWNRTQVACLVKALKQLPEGLCV